MASMGKLALFIVFLGLCGSMTSAQTAYKSYTFPAITGIAYSVPVDAIVSVNNGSTTDTVVSITGDAALVNNASFTVSGGNLTASIPQYLNNPQGSVTIQVANASLTSFKSENAQTGAAGNVTLNGTAFKQSGQAIYISNSAGSLVTLLRGNFPLVADVSNRTPLQRQFLNVSGGYLPQINYTGGPATQASISAVVGPIGVTMYQGSSLNITSVNLPSVDGRYVPHITGTYTTQSGSQTGSTGYIYYDRGTCDVTLVGTGQATACKQVSS